VLEPKPMVIIEESDLKKLTWDELLGLEGVRGSSLTLRVKGDINI